MSSQIVKSNEQIGNLQTADTMKIVIKRENH